MKQLLVLLLVLFSLPLFGLTKGEAKAVKGGSFVVGFPGYPKSLLTYLAAEELSAGVSALVLESLMEVDPDTYEMVPLLATAVKESPDHKTFTFTLNPNAKFFDGTPVTADDVKFTWDTIMNKKNKTAPYQSYFAGVESCTVIDKGTVQFKVTTLHFKNVRKLGELMVLPKHKYSKRDFNRNFNQVIYGSGPYILEEAQVNKKITMKRNPNYWGLSLPQNTGRYNFDKIVFKTVEDYTVQYELFKKGEIDYFYFLSSKMWATETDGPQFKKNYILKAKPESLTSTQTNGVAWNLRNPLFQDVKVRQALAHLQNREKWIKDLFYNAYTPACGIIPCNSEFHAKGNDPLLYNPGKAKELLNQAGWKETNSKGVLVKDGKPFEFSILLDNPGLQKVFTVYQEDLKKAGIIMNIRLQDWASSLKLMDDRQFDAFASARGRDPEPSDFCIAWSSKYADVKGSMNISGFKNPKVDELCEKIDQTFEKKARTVMVQELDALVSKEQPMSFGWEASYFRIGMWNRFSYPSNKGAYRYSGWKDVFHYWWYDEKKAKALKEAVAKNVAFTH